MESCGLGVEHAAVVADEVVELLGGDVAHTVDDERFEPAHSEPPGDRLHRDQHVVDLPPVEALRRVGRFDATGRGDHTQAFALEHARRTRPVGPAAEEHGVEPGLQQAGRRIPVRRVLQHDCVGGLERPLLGFDVDGAIRIEGVEVAHGDAGDVRDTCGERGVDARVREIRMREDDESGRRGCVGLVHELPFSCVRMLSTASPAARFAASTTERSCSSRPLARAPSMRSPRWLASRAGSGAPASAHRSAIHA